MCLYHYTSLENFFSIVQGRELWLTNIHFLNDYMENRLFLATAANLMRERAATEIANVLRP